MQGKKQRSSTLTVLCLLTFVGSGLICISFLVIEGIDELPIWYRLLMVFLNLLTAWGAWQLWRMKKRGLYVYTIAELLAVVIPFLFVRAAAPAFAAFFGTIYMFLVAAVSLIMIFAYWFVAGKWK